MKQETIKRNIIFILLIGIEGLAFGLIDWDSVVSDLVYLQYNNKILVSLITANVSVAKIIATLICIYINDYKKPNKIFIICVILCAIGSFIIGIAYNMRWLNIFAVIYILEALVLEIFSGYHYAYVYNSLPLQKATEVHSKRISIFKITFMFGIGIASLFTTKFINNTMFVITTFSGIIFLLLILPISKVKNDPKYTEKNTASLIQKLNLKNYTQYYRSWIMTRFLGKFALSSLVVLLSMIAIDNSLDLAVLKIFKTSAWFLSSIGFWISAYLIKNKLVVKGDILCKSIIVVLVAITFFCPYVIYIILLINGLNNPFNTMSNFAMIQSDKDKINIAQKEMIINLFSYFSGMISSYILLNINVYFALILIIITLLLSIINETRLYILNQNNVKN